MFTEFNKQITMELYKSMLESVQPENVARQNNVCEKLDYIKTLELALPKELTKKVDKFVEQTIEPILEPDYIEKYIPSKDAYQDENGNIVLETETAVLEFVIKIYDLERAVNKFAQEELQPYLI